MAQSKLSKLLEASDRVQLPAQERYEFIASKMSYFLMGGGMIALSLFLGYLFIGKVDESANYSQNSMMAYGIPVIVFAMGLAFILGSLPAKVVLDDDGMSIPGVVPFFKEKLAWDSIKKAELTSVIYSSNGLIGFIKGLFGSFFAVMELRMVRSDVMSGSRPAEYAIMNRVQDKDQALVLRIVREKLGDRFTIY